MAAKKHVEVTFSFPRFQILKNWITLIIINGTENINIRDILKHLYVLAVVND